MKKQIFLAILFVALVVAGVCAYFAVARPNTPDDTSNAAFRDGTYLGTRDAKGSGAAHVAFARWSRDVDRSAFIRGYNSAYRETSTALDRNKGLMQNASAAYRDGIFLGKLDAEQGRAAHVSTGRWAQARDRESFGWGYRQAYLEETAALGVGSQARSQAMLLPMGRN